MVHRLRCVTGLGFPWQGCTYKTLLTFAANCLLLHCNLIVYQVQYVLSNGLTTWKLKFSRINLIRQERISSWDCPAYKYGWIVCSLPVLVFGRLGLFHTRSSLVLTIRFLQMCGYHFSLDRIREPSFQTDCMDAAFSECGSMLEHCTWAVRHSVHS